MVGYLTSQSIAGKNAVGIILEYVVKPNTRAMGMVNAQAEKDTAFLTYLI